jgi:hypothetical protein
MLRGALKDMKIESRRGGQGVRSVKICRGVVFGRG